MSVDKIGSVMAPMAPVHAKTTKKDQLPHAETQDVAPQKVQAVTNEMIKIDDPPFFPICVTQGMFKLEK